MPMMIMRPYLNMLMRLFILILLLCIYRAPIAFAQTGLFPAPRSSEWLNPYLMLNEKNLKGIPGWKWEVFAAYQGAPLERGDSAKPNSNMGGTRAAGDMKAASYLERFEVLDRLHTKLKVRSMVDKRVGWMDMRDLLLFARPLRNPQDIALKAFLRIDLGRRGLKQVMEGEESAINMLRFRDGPGIPQRGNNYRYLISEDDVNKVSSLFLYIYAVHFNNNQQSSIEEIQKNLDKYIYLYKNLDKVDYVLLGTGLSFNAEDLSSGESIRGWLPASAVQYWETRLAVEQIPGMPAHQFKNRSDLLRYFSLAPGQQREEFLRRLEREGKAQRALDRAGSLRGQDMRYLVLDRSNQGMNTVWAGISDISKRDGGEMSNSDNADTIRDEKSLVYQGLADAQLAAKYLDLFFLVDGTASMEGPVESAAKVIEKLTEHMARLPGVKLSIRAAVYRDQKDKTYPVFEDWDPRHGSPSSWLRGLLRAKRIGSGIDDKDFNESLFYGLRSAIRAWEPHFQHTDSTRIMFVLGDAGDNGEDISTAEEIGSQIQKASIFLFPLHFNHPLKDDEHKQLGSLSKLGAICEEKQWQNRINEMYGSASASKEAKDKYAGSIERISMCSFIAQMADLAKWDTKKVRSLTSDNIGTVLQELTSTSLISAKEMVINLQKLRQGRITLPEARESMERLGDIGIGIFQHRIQKLKQQVPKLAKLLEQRPELAYSELYIAEKDGDQKLLRPVLLISQRELGKIISSMANYTQQHRQCYPDTFKLIVTESLTTLIGELLLRHPDLVTDADIREWRKDAMEHSDSYLGAPDLIKQYCRDNRKWVRLLERLRQAIQSLSPLLSDQPHQRRFTDINGNVYFWLYPEEIFPLPK